MIQNNCIYHTTDQWSAHQVELLIHYFEYYGLTILHENIAPGLAFTPNWRILVFFKLLKVEKEKEKILKRAEQTLRKRLSSICKTI